MKKKTCLSLMKASGLLAALFLSGCDDWVLMDPKGPIGQSGKSLILTATWLMLIVVVPVIVMTLVFAWKYRASNKNATYAPKWAHSHAIEVVVWFIPCVIIGVLALITWKTTHELDPYKPLESEVKPLHVQVVALDWKWLFIYPEQNIASVNELAIPTGTPIAFDITSASVMNAFFIPQLGSQIYAMAGMNTKLHLLADEPGTYMGMSANYSGSGFSGMKFDTLAMSTTDFNAWVEKVKAAPQPLEKEQYTELVKPSEANPVAHFSSVESNLYQSILNSYGSYCQSPSATALNSHEALNSKAGEEAQQVSMNVASEE
ncbi:ubiquinol oxidase subunit II [Pokkaliibacter plantistimulans]|uniref:Ubiquinol oxidase subunit 2 n=1 Tax=Proteobacteria bacterium 228 TaxID=2083153 RepID=A0A2S5KLD0_9PROT|nr:ubiquinol oxidase subunit II [Pokkaliibacter plantistimulans]PPC75522.1 ubiquinol oxidase subunit II [Pokkaliibacter plantistimulans]